MGDDRVEGNSGNNLITGGDENDTLVGGRDDDERGGNAGEDNFLFGKSGDKDTVLDFENDIDTL